MPPRDRLTGCLVGLAAGDALGAPLRGMTAADVFRRAGLFPQMLAGLPAGPLAGTNTPRFAVAVAEHLAVRGEVVGPELVRDLAAAFDPDRPHVLLTREVLDAVRRGGDWRGVAADSGNDAADAAVRAAAVGLLFAGDPDRAWAEAKASARTTHADPLAVEGAQLFALAVALAATANKVERRPFLSALLDRATADDYRWALKTAAKLKRSDSVAVLGSDPAAARSVVTAVACFAATPTDFDLAVGRAVGLGGATDLLGAMTAALVGAASGVDAVPNELVRRLDIAVITAVAGRLADGAG